MDVIRRFLRILAYVFTAWVIVFMAGALADEHFPLLAECLFFVNWMIVMPFAFLTTNRLAIVFGSILWWPVLFMTIEYAVRRGRRILAAKDAGEF